jgi:6-phosphofructokinase 1
MVALKNNEIKSVPLSEVSGKLKLVAPNDPLVIQAQNMGTSFGI